MSMVVIGSVFVDVKGYPIEEYIPGGRNAGRVEQVHGGVARNIAEDIAHVGEPVTFVSLVDETGAGTDVIDRLRAGGAETKYIRRTPDGMGTWLAVFDHHNEVAAAISKRPDLLPIGSILDDCGDEIFANADSALLELDLEPETVEKVYRLAEKHGVPVYAAVSNMRIALQNRAYLPKTACFVCNEQEADILFPGKLTGLSADTLAPALQTVMGTLGMDAIVVTLAEQGAVYASAEACGRVPAEQVAVMDTAGAGDAFFAGVSVGLSRGASLKRACEIGTLLAAKVISTTENVCPTMTVQLEEA